MSSAPSWLSPIVTLEQHGGDVERYLESVFALFKRDFIDSTPVFDGKKVFHDRRDDGGKPAAFVHITTEGDQGTGERNICLRRCERIEWVRLVIDNAQDEAVLVWKKEHFTSNRHAIRAYLFLESEDFLLILENLPANHMMITAIYVDNPKQKERHLKDYKRFVEHGIIH